MAKAFYFEDPLELCDFVKSLGSGLPSDDAYDLYRVAHPDKPRKTVLLLCGLKTWRKAFRRVAFEVSGSNITWESHQSEIQDHRQAKSLLEFVDLQPWRASDQHERHVIFWLRDGELLPQLVKDSLRLQNDRVQYAQIGETPVLRIEQPSFYLIQRCLEDYAHAVELFYPAAEDLYLPWGQTHPLTDLWHISEQKRDHGWIFFRADATREHVEPLRWHDVYELTEFQLNFPHDEIAAQSKSSPPKFEVPLRLQLRSSLVSDPELWLLNETGQKELEGLLQLVDEEQIRPYHLAVQTLEGDADDFIFVREKRSGAKRKHLDFSGQAFAHYQGLNNFFLPVGQELMPPLRRDLYRGLFKLEPGIITVVVPSGSGNYRIVRIRERTFQTLTSFLDYIVQSDIQDLEDCLKESVFDFGEYLSAPLHAGLRNKEAKSGKGGSTLPPSSPKTRKAKETTVKRLSVDEVLSRQTSLGEEQLEGLQRDERENERAIVREQSLGTWQELLLCKHQLAKRDDAMIAAAEGWWLCQDDSEAASFRELLRLQVENFKEPIPRIEQMDGTEPDGIRRATLFRHLENQPDPDSTDEVDQWVAATTAFLQQHDQRFRAKERWLAWGQVLRLNKDERREAQVREEILSQIGESGLGIEETPAFIRTRIFLDRGRSDDEESEEGAGAETALANLEGIEKATDSVKSPLLKATMNALLSVAHGKIGNIAKMLELTEGASPVGTNFDVWCTLFHSFALESEAPERAKELQDRLLSERHAADRDTQTALEEQLEIHKRRAEIDNPAAFLAEENRGRSYPSGGLHSMGVLNELAEQLRDHLRDGDEVKAVQVTQAMMTLDEKKAYDDHVKLPQFVEEIVTGIDRFKWGDRGSSLLPIFERFAETAPSLLSKTDPFYLSLLHANLATGLLSIESPDSAMRHLNRAITALQETQTELDFADGCAAVMGVIEQFQLRDRAELVGRILAPFVVHFDNKQSHYLKQGRLFSVLVRLLQQVTEAAISRDRISLNQFKNYQLQDEFLILRRLQRESFSS